MMNNSVKVYIRNHDIIKRRDYQMNLYSLVKIILTIEKNGLSKVRFAKTIYFVHKELIRDGVMKSSDIQYIRMPLGPVPEGFMTLSKDFDNISAQHRQLGLAYDSVVYTLKRSKIAVFNRNPLFKRIEKILSNLTQANTSNLVEVSHNEPSWIANKNSDLYSITEDDMALKLPAFISDDLNPDEEYLQASHLQASLIKGMIDDIVNESTSLEYPSDGK